MKNIYKITKGQLITIIVFGSIGFFVALSESEYSGFATFLAVLTPAGLVFYTIGWRSVHKSESARVSLDKIESKIMPSKKSFLKAVIIILLIVGMTVVILCVVKAQEEKREREQLKQEYDQAVLKVDSLREQVNICVEPIAEKKFQEELRSCNLLKNKIKADYDFCLTYTSVSPRASCLYDYDYEKIDCSEETLRKTSRSKITQSDVPDSCALLARELVEVNATIKEYSEQNK